MTAPTLSAYPAAVEALIPKARDLADQLGEVPSRNRLMKEFRVGAPKAIALCEALTADPDTAAEATAPDPTGTETAETAPDTTGDNTGTDSALAAVAGTVIPQEGRDGHPDSEVTAVEAVPVARPVMVRRRPVAWPVLLLALPTFAAIWSGWVSLGELAARRQRPDRYPHHQSWSAPSGGTSRRTVMPRTAGYSSRRATDVARSRKRPTHGSGGQPEKTL